MNTTPTPLTDAEYVKWQQSWDNRPFGPDFARKLERKLAIERGKHAADVAKLRDAFAEFADHFRCFEHTSSDPSDSVAFKKARAIIAEHSE